MPFIESILKYESVAFVGMEKNCGKTEAMNYFLKKAVAYDRKIAVTSIGVDGERIDQVTSTSKPEIELFKGDMFLTCELYYKNRRLVSEIIDISQETTALGRLVTAKVLESGKVMLAGPADTAALKREIKKLKNIGCDLVVVDGALSRLSIASPTITDALVLSTGAVVSHRIEDIVEKSAYQVELIRLPKYDSPFLEQMNSCPRGVYSICDNGLINSGIDSVFTIKDSKGKLLENGTNLFFAGVISDAIIEYLTIQPSVKDIEVVVRDFSKIFVSQKTLNSFTNRGGRMFVVNSSKLLAVCVNPVSTLGYTISSEVLCRELSKKIEEKGDKVIVIDVVAEKLKI